MDLTRRLLRFAAARPHVLLAELPGGGAQRLAVEAELRRRGWPTATSPADADLLVLAGHTEVSLGRLVNRLWSQLAKPRALAHASATTSVPDVLDDAHRMLIGGADPGGHVVEQQETDESTVDHAHEDHNGQRASHDHGGGHDHAGGHDHGGMTMPGGLAMADRGPDRDGLQLDRLHVPLGPFLPNWPAGLVVHTTLQGDVIQRAEPVVLGAHAAAPGRPDTALLDSLARLLAVAGWDDLAARARLLRDGILGSAAAGDLSGDLARLIRRLRRARTLRWLTDDLGTLSGKRAREAGLRGSALRASYGRGDVTARWLAWLDELERPGRATAGDERPSPRAAVAALPELLRGTELASARLIVASLDPDLKYLPGHESAGGYS